MGDAQAISLETASRDAVVSALMLNFVPDKLKALMEMKRVARAGATVGFYVWDYPGQGVEFMRAFWDAAAALELRGTGARRGQALFLLHAGWSGRIDEQSRLAAG